MFHFKEKQICVNNEWVELKRKPNEQRIQKIYVTEDTLLLPSQQTEVNARVRNERNGKQECQGVGLLENGMIEGFPHVYSARCLVPARNSGIKILVLNANQESQVLTEGTEIGEVQGVEIVSGKPMIEDPVMLELTEEENDVLKKIMETLPSDLTNEQQQKAWELLVKYRTIMISVAPI